MSNDQASESTFKLAIKLDGIKEVNIVSVVCPYYGNGYSCKYTKVYVIKGYGDWTP